MMCSVEYVCEKVDDSCFLYGFWLMIFSMLNFTVWLWVHYSISELVRPKLLSKKNENGNKSASKPTSKPTSLGNSKNRSLYSSCSCFVFFFCQHFLKKIVNSQQKQKKLHNTHIIKSMLFCCSSLF